jgi:hypothetical protein
MARAKATAEEKTQVNMTKADKSIEVELIGSPNELIGTHVIYFGIHQHIEFTNGKTKVLENVANELRKQGMVK